MGELEPWEVLSDRVRAKGGQMKERKHKDWWGLLRTE